MLQHYISGLQRLYSADENAINWLKQTAMKAVVKWN